ncbi:MAG: acyl-CoA synthetase FdrA [Xanthobacteraceae bacterium]
MPTAASVIRNFYRDSVALMQLSARLGQLPGIRRATAIMASEANRALLHEAGLTTHEVEAGPNDLLIAIEADSEAALEAAMAEASDAFDVKSGSLASPARHEPPRSLEMGLEAMPAVNLALISTPGDYAAAEATKALHLGLNVMLFSNNVALEDEIALKRYAGAHGLMVMGPDCGTAILGGIPLGFANVVRRGDIGLVSASGTGLQQVTCLIDQLGHGVSQAIGTGGRDLRAEVGGLTMHRGLDALAGDAGTRVIVLISKAPAPEVAVHVLESARKAGKPVIVNFLGTDPKVPAASNIHAAKTLEDAAVAAVALSAGRQPNDLGFAALSVDVPRPGPAQLYVRGLYSGGTFCSEAAMLLSEHVAPVYSNTPIGGAEPLADVWHSRAHTLIDLGDDVFTRGRPHPMIDHRLRNERIAIEARDPQTAVLLLDVVLGYGSHPDPAAAMAPAIAAAIAQAADAGRRLVVIGFVCGTEADPQDLKRQQATLTEVGMIVTKTNAQAVRLAARIAAPETAAVSAKAK